METLGGYPVKTTDPKAKKVTVLLSLALGVGGLFLVHKHMNVSRDFYSYEVKDAKGRPVQLEKYRGKVSLVVNVANPSEHTEAQYRALQDLHRVLGPSHFTVLAFPCGQFGPTEPMSSRDTEAVAKSTYGLTFPIFSRIRILGSEAEPAFRFLTDSVQKLPKWNFWKFLVNTEGKVVQFWRDDEPMESIRQEATALVREIILKKRVEL